MSRSSRGQKLAGDLEAHFLQEIILRDVWCLEQTHRSGVGSIGFSPRADAAAPNRVGSSMFRIYRVLDLEKLGDPRLHVGSMALQGLPSFSGHEARFAALDEQADAFRASSVPITRAWMVGMAATAMASAA